MDPIFAVEKRTGKRLPMHLLVSGRCPDGSTFEEIGETRDVSAGGVYFYTESRVAEGSPIDLLLPLPPQLADRREVWVLCKGEVARVEPIPDGRNGVGVLIESYEMVPEA